MRNVLAALCLVCLLSFRASAAIVYDNSIPLPNCDETGANDPGSSWRIAPRFILPKPAEITGATFIGGYYGADTPTSDLFSLTIFNDLAGVPDPASIAARIPLDKVTRTYTGVTSYERIFHYSADFAPISLAADTAYWLMIVNDTTADNDDLWVWYGAKGGGQTASSGNSAQSFDRIIPYNYAFTLTGSAIPEPHSLALVSLASLVLVRRPR